MSISLAQPHDLQAETAVLGCVLLDQECWSVASEVLREGDFYAPANFEIFRAMQQLVKAGSAIDFELLKGQLRQSGQFERAGGDEHLLSLTDVIPTLEHVEHLAKRVRDLATIREVMQVAMRLAAEGGSAIDDVADYFDRAGSVLAEICERRSNHTLEVTPLRDLLDQGYAELIRRQSAGETLLGYATGFATIDHVLGGFVPGDLIVVAGRPGSGKTAFANALKLGIARSSRRQVLSLELEMNKQQLTHRVFAHEALIDLRRIRAAKLAPSEFSRLAHTADKAGELPIEIITRRETKISELRATARKLVRTRGPLGLLVVDYLQIVRPERREDKREQEVSAICASLKSLAGELDCPVLALSQLNRSVESRPGADRRPRLSDLRESGAIEQDADTVLFLHREELYDRNTTDKGIAELIIGKQRSGAVGTIRLRYIGEYTRFDDLADLAEQSRQAQLGYDDAPDQHPSGNGHGHDNGHNGNGGPSAWR
jgi:replicative DNA helicase